MSTPTLKVSDAVEMMQLAEGLQKATESYLLAEEKGRHTEPAKGSEPWKQQTIYASAFTTCTRQMTLQLEKGHELPPWSAQSLAAARRGKDREHDILRDLREVGQFAKPRFEVVEQQQRVELRDKKGRVAITGKIEGKLYFPDSKRRIPFEVKSWISTYFRELNRFEQLFEKRFTRRGAYQLLAYLLGTGEPVGLMILDTPTIPQFLPVFLWYEDNAARLDDFLTRAEEALDHRKAGTLPDYTTDVAECQACKFFGGHCNPPIYGGIGLPTFSDQIDVETLKRHNEIEATGKEYIKLHEWAKKRFRGVEMGICGDVLIEGKFGNQSHLELPPEQKKLLEQWEKVFTKTDPKGRFTLKFLPLAGGGEIE